MVKAAFKLNRGWGAGTVFATQQIKDVYSLENGIYGAAIVDNSAIKMIFKLNKKEVSRVNEELELDEEKTALIEGLSRGQCIISTENNNIPVEIRASEFETMLMDTDADKSRIIFETLKKKKGNAA
jgi:hypothetical protein